MDGSAGRPARSLIAITPPSRRSYRPGNGRIRDRSPLLHGSGRPRCCTGRTRGIGRRRRPKVTLMDHDDYFDLSSRLGALEAHAPATGMPPALPGRRRRGRFAMSMAMASVLVLAAVATATAGAVVVANLAEGHPGIQNPGQPLAGAHMECMSPPEADAFLAAHGFANVDWQVETGSATAPDGGKGSSTTAHQSMPPAHGYVIPGSVLDD